MITIIIHGPRHSGKTAVAHAIKRELARLQATVVIKDDDHDQVYAEQNAQKIIASKKPQVLIKIIDLEAEGCL
jgi:uridine kinase